MEPAPFAQSPFGERFGFRGNWHARAGDFVRNLVHLPGTMSGPGWGSLHSLNSLNPRVLRAPWEEFLLEVELLSKSTSSPIMLAAFLGKMKQRRCWRKVVMPWNRIRLKLTEALLILRSKVAILSVIRR